MPLNTIVLVDDEPRLLAGIRRRLSNDFNIVTFERGAEAIDYLSAPNDAKVIIADMQMPEMNGIELLKAVKDIAPNIRRLMLTGNSDQETAMAAINEGKVFRFIRKPCETDELITIINQALEDYNFQKADVGGLIESSQASETAVNIQKNFLSVISEELRTPLSQIITISEVVNRDSVKLDPQKLSSFLTQINKSGRFALQQVDRILEHTRLQSESDEAAENSRCDIIEVFNKVIASAKPQANEKLITLSFESLRKTVEVNAPHHSSHLMIKEIIENAVKFSPFGGHVSVIVKCDKDSVAARISNGGDSSITDYSTWLKDMSAAPFNIEDMSLDRSHNGYGLGLSIVHAISQKYGIGLDFKPVYGGGAAVVIVFKRERSLPASVLTEELQHQEAALNQADPRPYVFSVQ